MFSRRNRNSTTCVELADRQNNLAAFTCYSSIKVLVTSQVIHYIKQSDLYLHNSQCICILMHFLGACRVKTSVRSLSRRLLICSNTLIPVTVADLGKKIGHGQAQVLPLLETRVDAAATALACGLDAGETTSIVRAGSGCCARS
jgi:hypothetical protein